ncbi:MAG: HDOD domain-containing protein [Janthinobacterium lividum]
METERLDALVRQVRDLPALPDTVIRVMHLTDDPKTGTSDVAKALASDQALAARVLKLANSAFYGSSRRISTVSDAVVILGMRMTRNLVMATGCQDMLEQEVAGYALAPGALLRHSLACASAAQALAKRTRYRGMEEAFVAGLLHDIGKVVMNAYLRDQFIQVLVCVACGERTYSEAEQAVFGFDHAEAGAYLLERWNLPASLVTAVRYHHIPLEAPTDSPLPSLIHVADAICMTLGIGLGMDGLAYLLQPEALTRLHLTPADFEEVAGETCDMLSQAGSIF